MRKNQLLQEKHMEKGWKIKDLKDGMSCGNMHALVVEKRVGVAKNQKEYADITLQDDSGTIKCKKWDYSSDDMLEVGQVIIFAGNVANYQGVPQLTLVGYSLSNKDPTEFTKKSSLDTESLWSVLKIRIEKIECPMLRFVIDDILTPRLKAFLKAPAAKAVHNNWAGGLVEHVFSLWSLIEDAAHHYNTMYRKVLDLDLLLTAAVLHDLGKIYEYDMSIGAIKYRPNGILANHIMIGPALVYESANKFWFDEKSDMEKEDFLRKRDHLMHLIASHHGKKEFGSPVVPATLEAIILHHVDNMDTWFMHALDKIEKEGEVAGFSEPSWVAGTSFMRVKDEEN